MGSFDLLNREIKQYIFNQSWPSLTKIQDASIKYVESTDCNLILSAPTASGKTEAAFLPAINTVNDWRKGIKIVYISPLIALINDQFQRVNKLSEYLDIKITRWHGEASSAEKKKLMKQPQGILLITPESIEAMLVLRSGEARHLFNGVEWIIVDEIHGFFDNNRGVQLSSLLERIQKYIEKPPRYIGMSATLPKDDSQLVKDFFKNNRETLILADYTKNHLSVTRDYFIENSKKQSSESIEKIYDLSQKESMLVFPNSRGMVEYISASLAKLGKLNQSYIHYFAHHASLTKELRTSVEKIAKASRTQLFTICCTSTLEMGIDIGAVDSIVQYNAPYSVASLGQRLGRSGRKNKASILHFISTNPWELLQGLAVIDLYEKNKIERLDIIKKPYDVFAHQLLSLLLEKSGINVSDFVKSHRVFKTWNNITDDEFQGIINHLQKEKYIESLGREIISGKSTEELLRGPDFYAQFTTSKNFSVINDTKKIGEIPLTPNVKVDVNIFLAAKIWKISNINMESKKIYVIKAKDGNPPIFFSEQGDVSHLIRQKMLELLYASSESDQLTEEMKDAFNFLKEQVIYDNNPFIVMVKSQVGFRTFAGSKINRTIQLLMSIVSGLDNLFLDDQKSLISGFNSDPNIDIQTLIQMIITQEWNSDSLRSYLLKNQILIEKYMMNVKYKRLLPIDIQVEYIIENNLDLAKTVEYLKYVNKIMQHWRFVLN